jgi:hypothetical protein
MSFQDLPPHMILFLAGVLAVIIALTAIALNKDRVGNVVLAAGLGAGFAAFTAVTIWSEGVGLVVENHTLNLWGVQVWYDLLFSVSIALFFILPRARAAGMKVLPWVIFVALTASIGLLAMAARLFWLERHKAQVAGA